MADQPTTNLFLHVWRELSSYFNHTELAENWDKIDAHDHSPGKGVQITTEGIGARQVVNQHIAPGAIQDNVIADRSITAQKIFYQAVQSEHIAEGNVTSTKMGQFSCVRVWKADPPLVLVPYTGGTNAYDITFDRVLWDGASAVVGQGAGSKHWSLADPVHLQILESGMYAVSGHLAIGPAAVAQDPHGTLIDVGGGIRELRITDASGHSYARSSSTGGRIGSGGDTVALSASTVVYLQAGHRLKLQAYQSQTYAPVSGAGSQNAPSVIQASDYSPQLSIMWLGPAPALTS